MWQDPVIAEIRKIRLKIEGDCGNDFNRIFAQAMKLQNEMPNRLIVKPSKKSKSPLTTA